MIHSGIVAVGFVLNVIMVLFVLISVALILIVLVQKGKGGGLTGALSGGSMSNILGSQAKGPLTWITIGVVGVFLLVAVILAKYYKPSVSDFGKGLSPATQSQQPAQQQRPAGAPQQSAPAAPAASVPADANAAK